MTDAIEAGARAVITDDLVNIAHAEYHKVLGDKNRSDPMRAALEAAIASLVPASAVAEMRERCAIEAGLARQNSNHIENRSNEAEAAYEQACDDIADAIRQLDLPPACGEYVVMPREPTIEQMEFAGKAVADYIEKMGAAGGEVNALDYALRAVIYRSTMLHAATRTGGGE